MDLSAVAECAAIHPIRDGEFANLGFLSQNHERMLVFLESPRYLPALLRKPQVVAVLTTPQLSEGIPGHMALGVCEQPRFAFAAIHNSLAKGGFYWNDFETEIHPTAHVHPAAWVAPRNVRIGPGTQLGPHSTVLERCLIGPEVVVGAGSILGGVGFQTARGPDSMLELDHAGGLVVEDRVRLLPGAVVATGLFREYTVLRRDSRVGARAFVSHAVEVGERAFIGHGAVVNGGVRIGRDAWVGPGAVIAQLLEIGEGAQVSLGSSVIRNVPAGKRVSGAFAVPHRRMLRLLGELDAKD